MTSDPPAREELARYLAREPADLMDELNVYAAAEGVTRGPAEAWDRLVPLLRKAVCDDWEWCRRRQDARFSDRLTLAFTVAEVLTAVILPWGVPVSLVAVLVVKLGLDEFCQCP